MSGASTERGGQGVEADPVVTFDMRWIFACALVIPLGVASARAQPPAPASPAANQQAAAPAAVEPSATRLPLLRQGDRIAIIGSSSTRIGVWPRTLEFLLRTRHPDLRLTFHRFSTGGGTFQSGLDHLDKWLDESRPTVVIFNYGGNDATAGRAGLPAFRERMAASAAAVIRRGARPIFVTPQAADARRSGALPAALRTLYAETMLGFGREKGWTVVDVHHPIETMQKANQAVDPEFTILRDKIHLTHSAYIGWGFLLYERLDLPFVSNELELTADGQVTASRGCSTRFLEKTEEGLSFTRLDSVLPILPPGPLPPRHSAPMEAFSRYTLAVTGLEPGRYEIVIAGQSVGEVDAEELGAGVNLNAMLLDSGRSAPWGPLAQALWHGRDLDRIGQTHWRFQVRRRGL